MVLYHHGIKGMHWGIRRFQNKDGSLTAEGIKRYRTDLNFKYKYDKYKAKQEAKAAAKAKQKEIKRIDALMKKNSRKLTAEELEERINRLAMETKIVDLERGLDAGKPSNKDKPVNNQQKESGKVVGFGKKVVGDIVSETGKVVAKGVAGYVGAKILKGVLGNKDDSESTSNKPDKNQSRNTDDDNATSSGKTTGAKGVKGMPWGVRDKEKAKSFDGVVDEDYSSDKKRKESTWTKWTNDFVDVDWEPAGDSFTTSYWEAESSPSTSYGKDFVSSYLTTSTVPLLPYNKR